MRPIFFKANTLHILDQRALPGRLRYLHCRSAVEVARAITDMAVRGAPLIGQAAAWGLYLDLLKAANEHQWKCNFAKAFKLLARARPTARNLKARLELLARLFNNSNGPITIDGRKKAIYDFLYKQEAEWEDITRRMAIAGAALLPASCEVITYCNAGRLATLGRGTALAVIEEGWRQGKIKRAWACETRPYLQGMRLTIWELGNLGIPATLITDSMAAHLMAGRRIGAAITGADRVAANGDSANKIGTMSLAIAARYFKIPFYIVAPEETIDRSIPTGREIVIEERSPDELLTIAGKRLAPKGAKAWYPAFDVTPHELITAIVTEKGIWRPQKSQSVRHV
ncbi:MAG: S-methyl-5-thioribose-1-phosphate isomerase [Elusimicrobia bacterium]|nr:S-methyl-5-thioribose-1-phosphate isomerase [Elusimicrobiota bacterium]